jgi:hypothetical protein
MSVRLPHRIETVSGVDFDYENPEVCLEDVAHGLAHECRFGRHTKWFYSVAEHSILVAAIVEQLLPGDRELALAALWHDAHEAYMGDVPTPLKDMLGERWHRIADGIDRSVAKYLGLTPSLLTHPIIKYADKTAMLFEASILKPGPGWDFTRALDHTRARDARAQAGLPMSLGPDEAVVAFKATHAFTRGDS